MRYIVMALVMVLTCLDLSTAQAANTEGHESLRGLPGVQVLIEKIEPDAKADGLTEEAIKTAVELILRSSGIRVLTLLEGAMTPSVANLYVNVSVLKSSPDYVYHVQLQLMQRVSLVHRPKHTMWAITWDDGATGIVGQNNLRRVISEVIEPKVKEFANDFLAVNPR